MGWLFAFDTETGETLWKRENVIDAGSTYRLIADGTRLYSIPTGRAETAEPVRAFDASNGDQLWSREHPSDTDVAGTVAGEVLCLVLENELQLLDSETGTLRTTIEHDFGFPEPPRIVDDMIFIEGFEEIYLVSGE